MKFVIQRVSHAEVCVEGEQISGIDKGLLVFVGVFDSDTKEDADRLVKKLVGLRIFQDENDKTNLSLKDVKGSLLIVSQFTLCADCRKGNRPSFINAGKPDYADSMYGYIISACREQIPDVQTGKFGADMKISLLNDGPFTILLDSDDWK